MIHVYNQHTSHNEVYIVATKESLIKLQKVVANAIETGKCSDELFTADGEGFDLCICSVESKETWERLRLPYSAEWHQDNRKSIIFPWELWYNKKP